MRLRPTMAPTLRRARLKLSAAATWIAGAEAARGTSDGPRLRNLAEAAVAEAAAAVRHHEEAIG